MNDNAEQSRDNKQSFIRSDKHREEPINSAKVSRCKTQNSCNCKCSKEQITKSKKL